METPLTHVSVLDAISLLCLSLHAKQIIVLQWMNDYCFFKTHYFLKKEGIFLLLQLPLMLTLMLHGHFKSLFTIDV